QQWLLMDLADPNLKTRPTYLDESEVLDYADRDGLYVVTTLRVRDTIDLNRARNSLSPLATQTAGIGRIQEDGGRHLIVGDFAPVASWSAWRHACPWTPARPRPCFARNWISASTASTQGRLPTAARRARTTSDDASTPSPSIKGSSEEGCASAPRACAVAIC